VRVLLLWCPDWPVIAAGLIEGVDVHRPIAVLHANRVVACSEAARAEGVRRGLRKREAEGRCSGLVVVEYDAARDARAFEPVLAAVEELTPGVAVVRPGACALPAQAPGNYYGGEEPAAERLVEQVALRCRVEAQVGVADGVFAALLAARAGRIVPPGGTAAFLAGMDVRTLDRPELADLLRRLGVRTLGDFAALPPADVLARLGPDAAYAQRLAAGAEDEQLVVRTPPPDLAVAEEFDPPLERVDAAAFAGRALAERLYEKLTGHGLAATRLSIEARTANGEELHRVWRHDGLLDAAALADRVRWQLDGWLTGTSRGTAGAGVPGRPTAGIDRLRLLPDGLVAQAGLQAGLWGEVGEAEARARRALVRVQGMLGPDAVLTGVPDGGRGHDDQVRLVVWGDERTPGPAAQAPWPGRLPAPSPAVVPPEAAPAVLLDADGAPVAVTARLAMSGAPARIAIGREPAVDVVGWAGPWPVDERWWAPDDARRLVRLQLHLADGRALLVTLSGGAWQVVAQYD
jgi:protein ImuB